MKSAYAVAAALAAVAMPAAAQVDLTRPTPAYSYFHRAGADLWTHDAELLDCIGRASRAVPYSVQTRNLMMGGRQKLIPGAINALELNQGLSANIENCMVVKGWEVATVSDALGKSLMAKTSEAVGRDFLAARVGEPVVSGGVARSWGNDAADPGTVRFASNTANSGKPSLSIKSLDPMVIRGAMESVIPTLDPAPKAAIARQLNPKDIGDIPVGSAVIVARVRNVSMEQGTGYAFERVSGVKDERSWEVDGGVGWIDFDQAIVGERPEGRFIAVVVPAGEWRFAQLGRIRTLNFCVGAPSFRIAPGEVMFAGTFDMEGRMLAPDMETIAARKFLKARPDLAEALKPATWVNGSTGMCGGNGIYALEFPNAAFAEGYEWGGARKAAPNP